MSWREHIFTDLQERPSPLSLPKAGLWIEKTLIIGLVLGIWIKISGAHCPPCPLLSKSFTSVLGKAEGRC